MNIYQTIRQFPEQFLKGWDLALQAPLDRFPSQGPRNIYYAGMGGSSLPADLLNDYLKDQVQLRIVRDYQLPPGAGPADWVLCASFSGNTEETLAVLKDAQERGCGIMLLANGGQLQEAAQKNNLSFIPIPDCIQPRCATGYFFASTLGLLYRKDLIQDQKDALQQLQDFLISQQDRHETEGKELAGALRDRVPIIYGPKELYGTCRIWKIKMNENAKVQSFFNIFPELNHNEMVGFTRLLMKPALVYLISQFMDPRIRKRMDVMKEVLGPGIPIFELPLSGKNLLQEIFAGIALGDYTSYYLAQAYGVDPTPVDMVEKFKNLLG